MANKHIEVVRKGPEEVIIIAKGIYCVFRRDEHGVKKLVEKFNPKAPNDPQGNKIPENLLIRACNKAVRILNSKHR